MHRRTAILAAMAAVSTTMLGCLESSPATLVTIEGSVTIPSAAIEVEHAGTTVSAAADGNGDFVIEIPEPASTDPLLLRAREASRPSLELVSLLPDTSTLVALAGSDAVLSEDEHPGTRITPMSTALYATMKAGFGRAPRSEAEVSEAELSMRSMRDGAEIVRLAAALQLIIEDPEYSLPAGSASTVAFAEDVLGARAYLEGLAAEPGGDPTAQLVEAMPADPLVATAYRADRLPAGYYDLTLHRHGSAGWDSRRWDLGPDGTGVAQLDFRGTTWRLHSVSWEVSAAGVLEVSYGTPLVEFPLLTVDQVVALYQDDAELQQAIRVALSSSLQVRSTVSKERFVRLWAGQAVDLVSSQQTVAYELSTALARYGVTAPDVVVTEDGWVEPLVRGDSLPNFRWTEAMTTGTRLMQVVTQSYLPDYSAQYDSGDPVMAAALVEFVDATTAVATGGVSGTPLALDYEILADGRLQLTYPTGEIQTVAILTQQAEELGLLNTFSRSTGGTFTLYDRSVRVDPAYSLSAAQLFNSAGEYWQSTMRQYLYLPTSTGDMPLESVFGLHFGSGGQLDRVWVNYVDPDNPTDQFVYRDETWTFHVDQGALFMSQHKDRLGLSRCDPVLEPSCFLGREIMWQPLAQHGDSVYVLEVDRRSLAYLSCYWDDDQKAWIDYASGSPVDPEAAYGWYLSPRINAYYVDDLPAL